MPADRFIHPKLGHSNKVSGLTDFEYRVWTQYLLTADDFGVMRASAVTLQADNDALHAKPTRTVQRALDHLVVTVGLLHAFEHQGRRYVYQRDWQDFQKVDYPRPTIEPKPSADDLAACSEATQRLFEKHPGGQGRRFRHGSPNGSGTVRETVSEPLPTTRAQPRETATATANAQAQAGKGSGENPRPIVAEPGRPLPGFQRLKVWRWMVDEMLASIGGADFDVDGWLHGLDADSRLVLPVTKEERWTWLQTALNYELRRRGLMTTAAPTETGTDRARALLAERDALDARLGIRS